MSEYAALKAEYIAMAGKNPPPMSADALRGKVAELRTAKEAPNQETPAQETPAQETPAQAAPQEPATGEQSGPASAPGAVETGSPATDVSPAAAPSTEQELDELGLAIGEDGLVGIVMSTGLSGPDVCLAPGDPHRCDAREAISLCRAGFAQGQQAT